MYDFQDNKPKVLAMKQFKVLDRNQSIHSHYLLEASAGTGKTFSIQNIVVRLLIEARDNLEPLSLQNILVVTFTRAATRDLKVRIRANIEQALQTLQYWQRQHLIAEEAPDYLIGCIQKGEESVWRASKCLQQALFTFDQANIFTIHSFCAKMLRQFALESDIGLHAFSGDEPLPHSEIFNVIRDFFRTEVHLGNYSPAQLEIILKGDPQQRKIFKLIQTGYAFPVYSSFQEGCTLFNEKMRMLKQSLNLSSEKMLDDFRLQIGAYRNYKIGETKAHTLGKITQFAHLFDQEEWNSQDFDDLIKNGLVWVKALNPEFLKGKSLQTSALHFPQLTQMLKEHLDTLIDECSNFSILMARMAGDCQKLLKRYQTEEEKLAPDDVLRKMDRALEQLPFLCKVQSHFQAAIIDEFQDTDPLQWQIFRRLFLSTENPWKGYLYLVGDPKQSIYSFRQADIYTYLSAAQAIGADRCFSLDVNYRSEFQLVQALNTLFSSDHLPEFIPLPKQSRHLLYQPVQAAHKSQTKVLNERGAIHFFIADGQSFKKPKLSDLETDVFFPFIAQEIHELRKLNHLQFHQFAVLVRDRNQAQRLTEYFDQIGIPSINQRGTSLAGSPAHLSLTNLMRAILHPRDRGIMRTLLGSPLMGWTYEELKHAESIEFVLLFLQRLRRSLFDHGFASFFQEMLQTACKPNGQTVLEHILGREGGLDLYRDLQQIADIIVDHQYKEWIGLEGIISFLDQFYVWNENEDTRIKRFQDPGINGVKILTLHFSKGLEFDVVFALGLVNRTGIKEEFIPVEFDGNLMLSPLIEGGEENKKYCEECDAEKIRQLYVALTRAKRQLYIPVALHLPSEKLKWGEASPLDLFLARLSQPRAYSYDMLYERIKSYNGNTLLEFLSSVGKENYMTFSVHQKVICDVSLAAEMKNPSPLYPPIGVDVPGKQLLMTSFSTLSHRYEDKANERAIALAPSPRDYTCIIKNGHTLPANIETGILMHSILEKINFKDFKSLICGEEAISLIRSFVHHTKLIEWESVIAEIIFNTLRTPLSDKLGSFCLADIEPHLIYREMPFLFPYKQGNGIEELEWEEGFIKGVIDALFYYQGSYYLLDWKTNWLGPTSDDYSMAHLQIAMKEHAYFLQASIYTEAVKRYLKLVEKRPFEECFGGVFYLFMRGIQLDSQTGIYHFMPANPYFSQTLETS